MVRALQKIVGQTRGRGGKTCEKLGYGPIGGSTRVVLPEKHPTQEEEMSPEAIQSLIELFGVERGVKILNLFTAPNETETTTIPHRPRPIRARRRRLSAVAKETVNVYSREINPGTLK
jgi:hypothetical protein